MEWNSLENAPSCLKRDIIFFIQSRKREQISIFEKNYDFRMKQVSGLRHNLLTLGCCCCWVCNTKMKKMFNSEQNVLKKKKWKYPIFIYKTREIDWNCTIVNYFSHWLLKFCVTTDFFWSNLFGLEFYTQMKLCDVFSY